MQCARCDFVNPTGFNYCGYCGSPLQQSCRHCGHKNRQQARFCNQCRNTLGDVCPRCGQTESSRAHFCSACGLRLEKVCPECQTINPLYANYCNHCGGDLPEQDIQPIHASSQSTLPIIYKPQPPRATEHPVREEIIPVVSRTAEEPIAPEEAEPEPSQDDVRFQQLQQYIPEALRTMILNTKGKIEGERKQVTMVFADLSGYTALSERFIEEPEEIAHIIDNCHRKMSDCIYKYEGIIDKIVGDEVMGLFGAPLSHENDAERAILASIEMIEQIEIYGKELDLPLTLHIGINTGTVVVGDIGTQNRLMNYTVIGDPVNVAARLEKVAQEGEIAVGENTYKLTRNLLEWPDEPLHVELKGKAKPQPVYKVIGRKEERGDMRGLEGLNSRMIGRDKEFQTLCNSFAKVEQGQGQLGIIMGEAGLGKSRLKREFKSVVQERALWIEGQCLSHTPQDANAYSVFLDAFRYYFGILGTDTEEVVREKLTTKVTALFAHEPVNVEEEILPFLFKIMSLPLDVKMAEAIRYLEQNPEDLRKRTFYVIHDLFEQVAKEKPLVLALEDLHWVDMLSIDLILFLMENLLDAPILLLCVYRPEKTDPCWRIGETARSVFNDVYTEVAIGRLEDQYMAEIFRSLLHMDDTEENQALQKLVLEKVQGNPFYMEEMIRSLLDNGVLVQDEENKHYILTQAVEDIEVPPGVEAIIRTRIDRLDKMQIGAKRTLQHSSVIGRIFERRILSGITEDARDLDAHFHTLMQLELIDPVVTAPESEYEFQHLLTYQIAYDSLILRRRRQLHAKVAEQIEKVYPISRYPGKLDDITNHYRRSDHHEKAIEYLISSGKRAYALADNERAIDCYREVLKRLASSPKEMSDAEQRETYAIAYEGLADTCRLMGKFKRDDGGAEDDYGALEAYLETLDYMTDPEAKARVHKSLGDIYERLAQWDDARNQYMLGLDIVGDMDSPQKPRLYNGLGFIYYREGVYAKAKAEYLKALEILEGGTDYVTLAEAYKNMAIIQFVTGQADTAFESMARSLDVAARTNNEMLLAKLYNTSAAMQMNSRNVDEAIEYIQRSLRIREKYGDLDGVASSKSDLGNAYNRKGESQRAIKCFEEVLETCGKTGNRRLLGDAYNNLGLVYRKLNNLDRAIEYLKKALELQTELHRPLGVATCQINIGDALLQQGDLKEAERFTSEAIRNAEEIGNQQVAAYAYHTLAEVSIAKSAWDQALMYCDKSIELGETLHDQRIVGDGMREKGRVYIELNDPKRAEECFNEARKLYSTTGDTTKLAEVDAIIEAAMNAANKQATSDA